MEILFPRTFYLVVCMLNNCVMSYQFSSFNGNQIIIKMEAGNGVRLVWNDQNGLLSTPAVSAVIRERVGQELTQLVSSGVNYF